MRRTILAFFGVLAAVSSFGAAYSPWLLAGLGLAFILPLGLSLGLADGQDPPDGDDEKERKRREAMGTAPTMMYVNPLDPANQKKDEPAPEEELDDMNGKTVVMAAIPPGAVPPAEPAAPAPEVDDLDEADGKTLVMAAVPPAAAQPPATTPEADDLDDAGGKTLVMAAVPPTAAHPPEDAAPQQGPIAGPLPEEADEIEGLDGSRTMVYMPAIKVDEEKPKQEEPAPQVGGQTMAYSSQEVEDKLAELRNRIDATGEYAAPEPTGEEEDMASQTIAYMPSAGDLPVDQAMAQMAATTSTGEELPQAAEAPTEPRFEPPTAPKKAALSPMPEGYGDDDDDDDELEAFAARASGGRKFLYALLFLGVAGGITLLLMMFDIIPRPDFLAGLPSFELNL